jgi:phosphoribosyl 1,2-cyclic phosphodiesterase
MSNFDQSLPQSKLSDENTNLASSGKPEFTVEFWGVRGLIPTPGSNTSRYGGNTACVEMHVGGQSLIFDGGTGLRILGKNWLSLNCPTEAHIFFTNSQSNRIQGFPFFIPAFVPGNCFHIYGAPASNGAAIKQSLYNQMLQPHFPYPLQMMQSEFKFDNLNSGTVVTLDDIRITTAMINKSHRSMGYRISWQEYNVAYVTDLQPNFDEVEYSRIMQLSESADLLIINATYSYPAIQNHQPPSSYYENIVELAQIAGVKRVVISHHHPDCEDDFLDKIEAEVRSVFPKTLLAREGLTLSVT